jgi:alanine dehydrogenase
VLPHVQEVKVFDKDGEVSLRYAEYMRARLGVNIRPVKTIQEATEADIVVTTTPSTEPVVSRHDIGPGTHINAIGADAKGKQELDAALLKEAKVLVDDIEQASHSGEVNVPLSQNLIKVEDIYGTIGEVVAGFKRGRENNREITIFDLTGLATYDIICARLVYEKARKKEFPAFQLCEQLSNNAYLRNRSGPPGRFSNILP